jgi:hypothetical protein
MSKPTFARPGDTSEPPVDDRLESWKEIASYLGRDIRTVYRWEADEALPVHRHLHKKRGTVYAYKTELDDWRNKRSSVESVRAESPMEHSGDSKPELAGPTDRHETAKLAVAGVVILGVAAIVVTGWQRSPATTLTDRDVLVLAEFSNSTGEPVFDVTLREALAAQLEESPFLMIMSDDQVGEDLRLMGRASGEHVSNQVAREICLREGNKATIGGSIVGLGKTYAITVQATNCQTRAPAGRG